MTIDLISGSGLFDRLGKLIYLIQQINDHLAGSGKAPDLLDAVFDKFATADADIRVAIDGLQTQLVTYQATADAFKSALQAAAADLLIAMAHADDPLPELTVREALKTLIVQMQAAPASVDACEPTTGIVYASGNDGDGKVIVSIKDGPGKLLERVYAEDLVVRFAGAVNDEATIEGDVSYSDKLHAKAPAGSDANITVAIVDPGADGLLTNPGFEDWTSGDADGWTEDVGSLIEDPTARSGTKSASFPASGQISQLLTDILEARKRYAFHVALRGTVASGSATLQITDGTSVLADEEGTNASLAIGFGSIAAGSWTVFTGEFALADPLPAIIQFELVSTLNAAVLVDELTIVELDDAYDNGPKLAVLQGPARWGVDDLVTVTITNDYRGAFQVEFDYLFDETDLLLPSDSGGTETIDDALIG